MLLNKMKDKGDKIHIVSSDLFSKNKQLLIG